MEHLESPERRTGRTAFGLNAALLAVALLALWEAASRLGWIEAIFFPAPSAIAGNLFSLAASGKLLVHLGATLFRVGLSLVIGGIAGMTIGWALGWSTGLRGTLGPFVAALHPLPKLALFPLFLVVLGLGDPSLIAVVSVSVLFPVLVNTQAGVAQIESHHWDVLRTFGAGRAKTFFRLVLPGSLPMTLVGLKLGFNMAFIVTIAAEMLTARVGLGDLVWDAWNALRVSQLFSALFVIMALGVAGNALLTLATRALIPWQYKENS